MKMLKNKLGATNVLLTVPATTEFDTFRLVSTSHKSYNQPTTASLENMFTAYILRRLELVL